MHSDCASKNCRNKATHGKMFCDVCSYRLNASSAPVKLEVDALVGTVEAESTASPPAVAATASEDHGRRSNDTPMSTRYPKYYKPIPDGIKELDFYAVCHIFNVNDAAISHALKKLLLPGVRTGGKSRRDDIKEARDTLTRWLELTK